MNYSHKLLFGCIVLLAACSSDDKQTEEAASISDRALVITSNYPLYYFATRITEGVDVAPDIVLPDIDGDPAFWIPTGEQVQQLQSADVITINGAGAESWLDVVTFDQRRLVDTSNNFADQLIPLEESVAHQHGPEGEHSHQGTAFTTWLDPQLAILQAQVLTETLIGLAPEGASQYRSNMAKLTEDLRLLDLQLAAAFTGLEGRPVLFSHPVYQYLQRRYEIDGKSVHWEPDEEPSTSAWIDLQQILGTHQAQTMIWEARPLEATSRRLRNVPINPVVFHIVANRPAEGDYLSMMRANVERLDGAL
jgi:zinc transport system substrate-binding protein